MKPLKPNKLTPGHNLKWESSRMMLPEHKEALIQHRQTIRQNDRPILDEQQLEEFSCLMQEAMQHQGEVVLTLFDPDQLKVISGKVLRILFPSNQIKLIHEEQIMYIPLEDIIDIQRKEI